MKSIRLDQALFDRKMSSSRTEGEELILGGKVLLNGQICLKKHKKVNDLDVINVISNRKYVSRGGEKLEGAFIDVFGLGYKKQIENKTALDIGSSTGGFTDFLIQNNIKHVDCVDVGTKQLHASLLNKSNISLYENTDIRNFIPTSVIPSHASVSNVPTSVIPAQAGIQAKHYDFIVADLSFISLNDVIDKIISFGTKDLTYYFLLIKPQFEVGRGNTKKGIVKDEGLVKEVLIGYRNIFEGKGFLNIEILTCKVKGGDGNQEYFLVLK